MLRKLFALVFALLLCLAVGIYVSVFSPLQQPPEIGRGLPSNFADASQEFQRRVHAEFPLPISEAQLVARLNQMGFAVGQSQKSAGFSKQSFPCTLNWFVNWREKTGVVSNITARYGGSCV